MFVAVTAMLHSPVNVWESVGKMQPSLVGKQDWSVNDRDFLLATNQPNIRPGDRTDQIALDLWTPRTEGEAQKEKKKFQYQWYVVIEEHDGTRRIQSFYEKKLSVTRGFASRSFIFWEESVNVTTYLQVPSPPKLAEWIYLLLIFDGSCWAACCTGNRLTCI